MNIRDKLQEYTTQEFTFMPKPFCDNICRQIINRCYKCSFIEAWEFICRNLCNIFGILSDIRLYSEEELQNTKTIFLNEIYSIEKLDWNKDLPKNYISTTIKLYFNRVDYIRIPKVSESLDNSFFGKKGINLEDLDLFNNPFVHKFYMVPLNNIGSWDIMYQQRQLTLEELTDLIYQLNDLMAKNNLDYEILYIVGEYVCLINKDKMTSEDLDFFCKNEIQDIRTIAYELGIQNDAYGWFSDMWSLAHNGYTTSLDEYLSIDNSFYEYLNLSKLTIMVQTDKCNLFTKLNSSRDKDIKDITNILSRLSLTTKNQVLDFIKDYLSLQSAKIDTINNTLDSLLKN